MQYRRIVVTRLQILDDNYVKIIIFFVILNGYSGECFESLAWFLKYIVG